MKYFLTIFLFIFVAQMQAQDLHFSQFMKTPLLINPANTGFLPDGDYQIGVNYRTKWASISAYPYKTMSAYGHWQLLQNSEGTGWLGVGGMLLKDVAGTSVLTSNKLYGSLAYHQMINYGSLLSLGFNVGWANKRINTGSLTFPSQWNGQFFDVHQTNLAPILTAAQTSYFDIQTGINYAYFPSSSLYINAGFSAMHLNRPTESFWINTPGIDNRVAVRYNLFLNASYKMNDMLIINPNFYYSRKAGSWEAVGGLAALYNVSRDGDFILSAGAYYRLNESLIPEIGLEIHQLNFTFSYDVTVSSLMNFNNRRGAYEISITKKGFVNPYRGDAKQLLCPTFR